MKNIHKVKLRVFRSCFLQHVSFNMLNESKSSHQEQSSFSSYPMSNLDQFHEMNEKGYGLSHYRSTLEEHLNTDTKKIQGSIAF
jgi:hypothetical protein